MEQMMKWFHEKTRTDEEREGVGLASRKRKRMTTSPLCLVSSEAFVTVATTDPYRTDSYVLY